VWVLQSKWDACLLALLVLGLPVSSHFAIHVAIINHWLHFWSMVILGCAPLAFICTIPDGLWWLPMSPRFVKGLSRLLLVLASLGLLAGGCAAAAWPKRVGAAPWPVRQQWP
jgi:hypothetical protein